MSSARPDKGLNSGKVGGSGCALAGLKIDFSGTGGGSACSSGEETTPWDGFSIPEAPVTIVSIDCCSAICRSGGTGAGLGASANGAGWNPGVDR